MKKQINESSVSRVWDLNQKHDCGFITAWRKSIKRDDKEVLNKKLKTLLQAKGYGTTKVRGSFIENFGTESEVPVTEDSFFVVDLKNLGTLKKDLMQLGQLFDQDSIIFLPKGGKGAQLIGTTEREEASPAKDEEYDIGSMKGGNEGQFAYTRVGSRAFHFGESVDVSNLKDPIETVNGKHGRMLLALEYAKELGLTDFFPKRK